MRHHPLMHVRGVGHHRDALLADLLQHGRGAKWTLTRLQVL